VGGHQPSLLEALASTKINLLIDVPSTARWGQTPRYIFQSLRQPWRLINQADAMAEEQREEMAARPEAIITAYACADISAGTSAVQPIATRRSNASVGREGNTRLKGEAYALDASISTLA
jgi:hypothetical protein